MNRQKTLELLLVAAACFAGGFEETTAQEITDPEMLEIRYTEQTLHAEHSTSYTNQVAKDVEKLLFPHTQPPSICPKV